MWIFLLATGFCVVFLQLGTIPSVEINKVRENPRIVLWNTSPYFSVLVVEIDFPS